MQKQKQEIVKKRVTSGGFKSDPTTTFTARLLYNSSLPAGKSEFSANKETAFQWFKNFKAFDTIDKNKSYAQALLCNLHQKTQQSGQVCQNPRTQRTLYTTVLDTHNCQSAKTTRNGCKQANSQNSLRNQMLPKNGKKNENCQQIGNKGSVTEAIETRKPLQLTNRFQPLLQIPMYDDVCVSQPMLTGQTKNTLVGKKNKNGFLDRGSDNGNIIPTQKQPIRNGPSKNVEAKDFH